MKSLITCFSCCILLGGSLTQKTYPSKVSYSAKRLYEMRLDMEPTSVRLLLDARVGNTLYPIFDLVMLATQPRSEIRRITDVTEKVNIPEQMASQLTVADFTSIRTPNSVGVLPENSIDSQPPYVWWITSGSFGAGSTLKDNKGGIYLIDMSQSLWSPQPIYTQAQSGFTHVEWTDMDLDGKIDCITISGRLNTASLIWLSQPRSGSGFWDVHAISNKTEDVGGMDFKTMEVKMPRGRGTRMLIVVAGRRTATLSGYWVDDLDNDWTQTNKIQSIVIAQGEAYVNVEIVDLNGDGTKDILTSVAAFGGRPGRLLAFEAPKSGLGAGIWRKRLLNEWIPSITSYKTLTPGPAYPFYISSKFKQDEYKPHIVVSGADDGKVYILSPDSWSPFIWTYSVDEIYAGDTAVGIPAVHDVDGDGNSEIFIPTGESIFVMRYQESNSAAMYKTPFLQTILCVASTLAMMLLI